jgi:hypothetical protein
VRGFAEALGRLAADALRGRIWREQIGMRGFEALEFMSASYSASETSGASRT